MWANGTLPTFQSVARNVARTSLLASWKFVPLSLYMEAGLEQKRLNAARKAAVVQSITSSRCMTLVAMQVKIAMYAARGRAPHHVH